jgi:hypothetical protein
MPDLAQLRGPVVVTVAYFVFWYSLLFGLQTRTKYRLKARYEKRGEVFDRYFGQDEEMLAVDRVVGNTHEQIPRCGPRTGGAAPALPGFHFLRLARAPQRLRSVAASPFQVSAITRGTHGAKPLSTPSAP